ncbi:MAG: type II toxin-antitoxin system HipA family toxin [Muribaculum sp.]|nr:type II toxin-antitoxin system HipA family toxin [Muribaculum sp.]
MVTLAEVYIWDKLVGYVNWNEQSATAGFEYEPKFVATGLELSPLMMPLTSDTIYEFSSNKRDTFMGLPGLLADALPDAYGRALLNSWLAARGRAEGEANPVERLCYQGSRSMGALEFRPMTDIALEQSSPVEIEELIKVAAMATDDKAVFQEHLDDDVKRAVMNIIRVGTSAGGQRTKAVIAINDTTGEIRSGQVAAPEGFNHWLIKFDGVNNQMLGDPMGYGRIEYVYYLMAKAAGIDMSECRLLEENGRAHFLTRRFDRLGGREKIHMQTLCGIAHYDFQLPGAYSYEQALMVMRRMRLPFTDAVEFFRRSVFNVVARNQDDHTKNISFLMSKEGKWKLSPAYDMAWAYNPKGKWTNRHQMSINGKRDNIKKEDLISLASAASISERNALKIIDEVNEAVSLWPKLAVDNGLKNSIIQQISKTHLFL